MSFPGRTATQNLVFSQSDSLNERLFRKLSRGINHDVVSHMHQAQLRRATSKLVSYSSRMFGCNSTIWREEIPHEANGSLFGTRFGPRNFPHCCCDAYAATDYHPRR